MTQSLVVYSCFILLMVVLGNLAATRKKYIRNGFLLHGEVLFSILVFAIIAGMRYNVGVDYLSYLNYYKDIIAERYNGIEMEFAFQSITEMLAYLELHFSVYFGCMAFLQLFFIYYAFKEERHLYPFLIFIIIADGTFFMWMNGIRQCIAITIFIFSIQYIKKRQLIKYLLCVGLAYLFHRSALIILPFYFIFWLREDYFKNKIIQLSLIAIAFALSNLNIWYFFLEYIERLGAFLRYEYVDIEKQLNMRDKEFVKSIRFYFPLIINIIVVQYSTKLKDYFKNTNFSIYYNLYFLGVLFFILFFNNSLIQRPAMYFIYSQFIIVSYLLYYLWKRSKHSYIELSIFASIIVLNLGILYAYISSNFYTYYYFFWENIAK